MSDLISCVMCTYGRFSMVQRAIAMFLAQTNTNSELIIFNTDPDTLVLAESNSRITIVNNDLDYVTNLPYTNVGDIRRDALTHATGDYYVCFDDDDVYLPYDLQQRIDSIKSVGRKAWKPTYSLWRHSGTIELAKNVMEASVIAEMESVRNIGYDHTSGTEGLSWYTKLRDEGQLHENEHDYIPAYCFNWSDPELAPHKQSGNIDDPNNFENHKLYSTDHAAGRTLDPSSFDLDSFYAPFYTWMQENLAELHSDRFEQYVVPTIK